MGLAGLTDWGPTAALEAMARFAGGRHRLISHNIANLSTPGFNQVDVSPVAFQRKLGEALDERRATGDSKPLPLESGGEVEIGADGRMTLNPQTPIGGVLGHDRNNRDLERLMQDQAENLLVFRTSMDLLRSRAEMMRSALGQRV
jgi:flagellar basal-body rod protein FlgB